MLELKRVPVAEQWESLESLKSLVQRGRVAFPRQVVREVVDVRHPDAPGAWLAHVGQQQQHAEPSSLTLRRVLEAAVLVEVTAEQDVADPYVVAMALELADEGFDPVVVSQDVVDRLPLKESIRTACLRLGIPHCDLSALLDWVRSPVGQAAEPVVPLQAELSYDEPDGDPLDD